MTLDDFELDHYYKVGDSGPFRCTLVSEVQIFLLGWGTISRDTFALYVDGYIVNCDYLKCFELISLKYV